MWGNTSSFKITTAVHRGYKIGDCERTWTPRECMTAVRKSDRGRETVRWNVRGWLSACAIAYSTFSRYGSTGHAELATLLGMGSGPLGGSEAGATTPGIAEVCTLETLLRGAGGGCADAAGGSGAAAALAGRAEAEIGGFCGLRLAAWGAVSGLEEIALERFVGGTADEGGRWAGERLWAARVCFWSVVRMVEGSEVRGWGVLSSCTAQRVS